MTKKVKYVWLDGKRISAEDGSRLLKTSEAAKKLGVSVEMEEYVPLFRGVGPRGAKELKSSEGGVFGPGVYFYTDPLEARTYAEPGGGILTGYAKLKDISLYENVAVLKDPAKFIRKGIIPTERTLEKAHILEDVLKPISAKKP